MINPYDILTLEETADYLHCGKSTLCNLMASKDINIRPPGVKVGKSWIFVRMDVVEYLRTRYPSNLQIAQDEQIEENTICQSKSARVHPIGLSPSKSTGDEYDKALGLQ
jgi:hypothetical protein